MSKMNGYGHNNYQSNNQQYGNYQQKNTFISNSEQYFSDDEKEKKYNVSKNKNRVLVRKRGTHSGKISNGRITKLNGSQKHAKHQYQQHPQQYPQRPQYNPQQMNNGMRRPQQINNGMSQPQINNGMRQPQQINGGMRQLQQINPRGSMQMPQDMSIHEDENLQKHAHVTTTKCDFYDGCTIKLEDGFDI